MKRAIGQELNNRGGGEERGGPTIRFFLDFFKDELLYKPCAYPLDTF